MICEGCERLRTENEQLRAALTEAEGREARVREVHGPVEGPTYEWRVVDGVYEHVETGTALFCAACSWAEPTGRFAHAEPHPCPTIRALDGDET